MNQESGGSEVTLRCGFCGDRHTMSLDSARERPACSGCGKPTLLDRPVKVAQEDFEVTVLKAKAPVLVDFYADWCAPCKMVAPLMDEIAHQHQGRVLVAKVDTDAAPEIALRYEIRSIPTIIMFEGGEETGRSLGLEPERVRGFVEAATG